LRLLSLRVTPHCTERLKELGSKVRQKEAELVDGLNAERAAQLAHLISALSKSIPRDQPGVNPCEGIDALR